MALGRTRVLVFHHRLEPLGGGEAVAVWALEALRDRCDLTVLTWRPPDLEALNRFYGTSLRPGDFRLLTPPAPVRMLTDAVVALDPDPDSLQRWSVLVRWARHAAGRYDRVLSTVGEMDLGDNSVQYFHYPYLRRTHEMYRALAFSPAWRDRVRLGLRFRWRPWRLVSGFSFERMRTVPAMANSDWTAREVRATYGIEPVTVYPPVPTDFPAVPWEEREEGFVCIGRITPEKRFEHIVEILAGARERGWRGCLHIVGSTHLDNAETRAYLVEVRALAARHRDWVTLHINLPREEMVRLVARQRYGIHGMQKEHFGIAVAEMLQAGCIVFMPCGGGQVELVRCDERLVYDGVAEAVEKICRVVADPAEQAALRSALAEERERFTTTRFMERIREVVLEPGACAACC